MPHGNVCFKCLRRVHYHPAKCHACGQTRPLGYRDSAGEPVCARCAGHPSVFACAECGSEAHPYGASRCARCFLKQRLADTLRDPATGQVRAELAPLFDAMVASHRPQNALTWLTRPPGHGVALLGEMARGEAAISHSTFEALPSDKTRNYLRDLLVSCGVLPVYQPQIARAEAWLEQIAAARPDHHKAVVTRFGRWAEFRRLRANASRGPLSNATVNAARARVNAAVKLMDWAEQLGKAVTQLTQTDLERYLNEHPGRRWAVYPFVAWLADTRANPRLSLRPREPPQPQVTIPDEERWRAVETLLRDDTVKLYARVAGLFAILFAQPLCGIVAMTASQVAAAPGGEVLVRFGATAIEMPPPIDRLVTEHAAARGHASYNAQDNGWLFPGGVPGRPMATENIRRELAERGIGCHEHRKTALFALAGAIPSPVLADLIGIAPKTAVKWAALASRDWAAYIAERADPAL
ncbi:MAG: hypothetical protein LBE08_00775 [Bifidobacteriaceae bacterium]|nr:hypothetical protein [Bifidobacteriaceae bacterium]